MNRSTVTFSAGPAMLPAPVLQQLHNDLVDWRGKGLSLLEISQWDNDLLETLDRVESDLRTFLAIPDEYAVLFLHGGASNQFAMVPMNLLRGRASADYIHTGMWSGKAIKDARMYARIDIAASSEDTHFRRVPGQADLELNEAAAYLHYTPSETAHGLQFGYVPNCETTLVADASSSLFATHMEVGKHGVIYASSQKNLGIVGMTLVIVRRDLIGAADPRTPTTFDYAVHERTSSRFTTPPVLPWYTAGLMVKWMASEGGPQAVAERCARRAAALFEVLDTSRFYTASVERGSRSVCSVPFRIHDDELTSAFLSEAEKAGLHALRGHPSLGGLRASMYVGLPDDAVGALVNFLKDFEQRYG